MATKLFKYPNGEFRPIRNKALFLSGALVALAALKIGLIGTQEEDYSSSLPMVGVDRIPALSWRAGGTFETLEIADGLTEISLNMMEPQGFGEKLDQFLGGRQHPLHTFAEFSSLTKDAENPGWYILEAKSSQYAIRFKSEQGELKTGAYNACESIGTMGEEITYQLLRKVEKDLDDPDHIPQQYQPTIPETTESQDYQSLIKIFIFGCRNDNQPLEPATPPVDNS